MTDDELRRHLWIAPLDFAALQELRSRFCDGMHTDSEYITQLENENDELEKNDSREVDEANAELEECQNQLDDAFEKIDALEEAFKLFCQG
jgi:hypothetical protein